MAEDGGRKGTPHRGRIAGGAAQDDGAAAFAEALRSNTSLTELALTLNFGIGEQGKQLLRDAGAGREGFELRR